MQFGMCLAVLISLYLWYVVFESRMHVSMTILHSMTGVFCVCTYTCMRLKCLS